MDNKTSKTENSNINVSVRQKILNCTLDLFSLKGYSETSIRDIAATVGITAGTIYNYFASKDDLLKFMLEDYMEYTGRMFIDQDVMAILQEKPTGEGVTACIMASIKILVDSPYHANLLHLVHQEQLRNDIFGDFLLVRFKETVDYVERIFNAMKDLKIIDGDVSSEYWGVLVFSLLHTIATCIAINERQKTKGYLTADIALILREMFDAAIFAHAYKLPALPADGE